MIVSINFYSSYRSNESQEKNLKVLRSNTFKFFLGLGLSAKRYKCSIFTPIQISHC